MRAALISKATQSQPEDRQFERASASMTFGELVAFAHEEERASRRQTAREAYELALTRVASVEDAAKISSIIRWIARTYVDNDAEAALDCLEVALAIAEAWGDDAAAGHAMNVQAVVRWQHGDMDDAERLYLLARSRAIRAGDAKLAAMTAQNLGVLANIRGDLVEAEQQYTASLAEYRSLGLMTDVCVALNNLGLLFILQKRWAEAESVLLEGVQVCESTNDSASRIQLDINLASLWAQRGEFVRAHGAVRKALATAVQSGDSSAIGMATKLLGVIARDTGNLDEAEQHFLQAEEVASARGEVLMQAEIARERATLARITGKNRDVLQQLNRAHRLFTQLRAQVDLATVGKLFGELEQDFENVARRWGESIEAKDRYTQGHCQRVAELACAIAKKSGMDDASLFWFRIGALLHDVGKIVIPPEVLNKPGKLDQAEWELMKSHTTAGVEMLKDIEFPWDVRPIVESHHERWDGKGYPHGIAGTDIPLIARILTIADVYDALTSVRSYKRALTHQETMDILRGDVGTIFDPQVFEWFEEVAMNWPARIAHLASEPPASAPSPTSPESVAISTSLYELDDLTRMPMRRAFRETLERVLAARQTTGRPVSMLIIDVDHFKVVNDTLGHLQGDEVLRLVAAEIRRNTRPSDYPARYAGDEFVVLLPGTRLEDACVVAERVRDAVSNLLIPHAGSNDSRFKVTLSIGVACAPMHGETMETLFGASDAALYGAKRGGRNMVMSAPRAGVGKQEVLLQCFVGRDGERERLRELFGSASAGSPQLVILLGEAGIGKSTLIKQLGPDVGIRAGAMLMGQCIEANVGLPYGPWADVVLAAHRAGLVPSRSWRELSRIVPDLGTEESPAAAGGSQRALLEELEDFLRAATSARPLMIVLDDMQWADPASWDTLEFLLARLGEQRLFICVTVRPEDMTEAAESRLRRLSRSERCHEMLLTRLSREELAQWLRSTLGGQMPPASLLDHVMRQSEGNAFFAVQTLRALVDERQLFVDVEGWHFEKSDTAQLPRAIGDLLARRVERLSRGRREILAMAAVLGREFDPEALVAACDCDEAAVHDALDEGLASAVLEPSPRARPTLTFSHVQLTRALLHGINPLRLRRMHEKVARALESMSGRDPATLAVHFDVAGASSDAYRTAHEAGKQSQSVYAYESAAEFFRIARKHARDGQQIANVEWSLAQVDELGGHFKLAEQHCDFVLGKAGDGAEVLGISAAARRMRERLRQQRGAPADETISSCTVLLTDARRAGNVEEEVALLVMLSTSQQRLGDVLSSERLARDAVEAAKRTSLVSLHADAVIRLGSVLLTTSPASAVPLYRRALDMYSRLGDRHGQLRCHINIGSACDRAGNQPAAEASYATALDIGRDIRANDLCGVASLNLGVLLKKTGKFEAAHSRFDEALVQFNAIDHQPYRLASLYNLAHLARTRNDAATALELYGACAILAESIRHIDVQIGAIAGIGLAELDLSTIAGAARQRERARTLLANRTQWWFQGRELWEALDVRLTATEFGAAAGLKLLLDAVARAEGHDQYAALWLGAECADLFHAGDAYSIAVRDRLLVQARSLGYEPLVSALSGMQLRLVA
jgi:diguanylate cyclase (GGDEF)-like protein/putative nucleotidyltransferase with HDIG domain